VVAVVVGNNLYVANAGDSRCVLCHGARTMALTTDHKPTNPDEEKRINEAGGFVTEGRVNGCLNLSRAIGDMNYKQVSFQAC
jgi:protein phosphatase 1G